MLTKVINDWSPLVINMYKSEVVKNSKNYALMKEENSLFENWIMEMKSSKSKRMKKSGCANPNCKNPFIPISTQCKSCGNSFCNNCIKKCENCEDNICKFCSTIKYEKYKDVLLCPNCERSYQS